MSRGSRLRLCLCRVWKAHAQARLLIGTVKANGVLLHCNFRISSLMDHTVWCTESLESLPSPGEKRTLHIPPHMAYGMAHICLIC